MSSGGCQLCPGCLLAELPGHVGMPALPLDGLAVRSSGLYCQLGCCGTGGSIEPQAWWAPAQQELPRRVSTRA